MSTPPNFTEVIHICGLCRHFDIQKADYAEGNCKLYDFEVCDNCVCDSWVLFTEDNDGN